MNAVPDAATGEEAERLKKSVAVWKEGYDLHTAELVKMAAERDAALAAVERVTAERDSAMARIAKAWELHEPFTWSFGYGPVQSCKWCADHGVSQEVASWPCPTVAALDGAPEPEWEYQWGSQGQSFEGFDGFSSYQEARMDMERESEWPDDVVLRRRKAGPWLPVEGESK